MFAAADPVLEQVGSPDRDEGLRCHYLHIDGEWRDHRSFALTSEDLTSTSLVEVWNRSQEP